MANSEVISIFEALYKTFPHIISTQVLEILSTFYGYPILDVSAINVDSLIKDILPIHYILNNQVLPLSKYGSNLKLAVVDPTNKICLNTISFKTGLNIDPVLIEESKLARFFIQNNDYFKTIKFRFI